MPIQPGLEVNTDHETVYIAESPAKSTTSSHTQITPASTQSLDIIIKIVGTPPSQSSELMTEATEIRQSPNPLEEIDALDAENEDPFTLESLEDLIKMHDEKGLDFILARVTTEDPDDPTRLYYSYYAAHHINKVLFRTESEKGLLHRMKAKNPLNNMTIVGDVHYYVVKSRPQQKTSQSPKEPNAIESILKLVGKSSADSPKTARTRQIMKNLKARTAPASSSPKSIHYFPPRSPEKGQLKLLINPEVYEQNKRTANIGRRKSYDDAYKDKESPLSDTEGTTSTIKRNKHHYRFKNIRSLAYSNDNKSGMTISEWIQTKNSPMSAKLLSTDVSPGKRKGKEIGNQLKSYYAHYYASDDDFLMFSEVRKYFKKNVLESNDAILFAIQDPAVNEGEEHPLLENMTFFMGDDGAASAPLFSNRVKIFIVTYAVATFVIVKFVGKVHIT